MGRDMSTSIADVLAGGTCGCEACDGSSTLL